ncbi:MAG: amino acid permease [Bacteroidales bacterium]|nr:amino acid permease [Bacteroidales bacterium]
MSFSSLFRKKSVDQILADVKVHEASGISLKRNLRVIDLTALGIAAVVGAGIFSTIGTAAFHGGPAVSLLFLFTAVACAFSAMCYARFASVIPISGSAYTYAYASFGELMAWIIGWDLIMEYAIGNIAVAISWSDYFTGLMSGIGIHLPEYLVVDYLSAARGYQAALAELANGITLDQLSFSMREAYLAWTSAPMMGSVRLIADIPAFSIVVIICTLVYIGIYETKVASNTMVLLKVGILLLIISVGSFYVNTENWSPFAPNGITGVLKGVSGVFFAYIGFDAISTTAEECRNPRRDLPRAIIAALIITTILYVAISLVLTGMVNSSELAVGDPLAFAFNQLNLTKLSGIIAISAVIAMAGVLLVFQVGQPRIWMSMSRDGLLPKAFSRIHRRFRTPGFATIVAGIFVAIPALFMNLTEVTDLCSIGTLFAFVLVSGGVLILDERGKGRIAPPDRGEFHIPYLNSRYFLPVIWVGIGLLVWYINYPSPGPSPCGEGSKPPSGGLGVLSAIPYLVSQISYHEIPILIFAVIAILITVFSIWKQWSLIPVLGLLTNLYLMAQLGTTNWLRFAGWLVIGLAIYFTFGMKHSKLRRTREEGRRTRDEGRGTKDEGRRTRDEGLET